MSRALSRQLRHVEAMVEPAQEPEAEPEPSTWLGKARDAEPHPDDPSDTRTWLPARERRDYYDSYGLGAI